MWVAELDRPWLDTPFLLQGFSITSDVELSALRKHCRSVWIDLARSSPEVVVAYRREAERLAALGSARRAAPALRVRPPDTVGRVTRWRFDRLASQGSDAAPAPGVIGWVRGLVGGAKDASGTADDAGRRMPATLPLVLRAVGGTPSNWPVLAPMREEMARADGAVDASLQASEALHLAIAADRAPDLHVLEESIGNVVDSMVTNPDAMLWASRLRKRQQAVYSHGVKAAACMVALGRQIGLPRPLLVKAGLIGLLADVGKTRIPASVFDKPGMLDEDEFALVKEHVRLGIELLTRGGALAPEVVEGIAQHHERLDGSGYPRGLRDGEIGLWGRMAAIVDGFTALTRDRAYADAVPPQDALLILYQSAGKVYDESLVEHFVRAVGVFPVGSLVMLASGEVAVVVEQHPDHRLEPEVLVLTDPGQRVLRVPERRDLLATHRGSERRGNRIARGLPPGAFGLDAASINLADKPEALPAGAS